MTNNKRYKKVYGSWQEGMYPFFKFSDVLTSESESIYWWDIDTGYAMGYGLWPQDKVRDLIPLFVIGVEDLEFLVERQEESDLIGYPKVISTEKIKDLIKPEILDPKECWEWVYIGRQGYEPDVDNQQVMLRHIQIEEFLVGSSSSRIWLKSNEEPLYMLRKRANFSKLERFYGRAKTAIERKISKIEHKTNKFFNNIIVTILAHVAIWLGTTALYSHYLGGKASVIVILSMMVGGIFFDPIIKRFANRVNKPFKLVAKFLANTFFPLTVTVWSIPLATESDVMIQAVLLMLWGISICLPTYLAILTDRFSYQNK